MLNNEIVEIEGGNKQPPLSTCSFQTKQWVMTWNNYDDDSMEKIKVRLIPLCEKYVFGFEIGELGTKHIQGAFLLKKRTRQSTIYKLLGCQFYLDKMKGVWGDQDYCKKSGDYITSDPPKYEILIEKFYDWQQDILDEMDRPICDRTIFWYWESEGCRGKTTIQKYIQLNYEKVIVLSGKAADMKNGIIECNDWVLQKDKTIMINIPRASLEYVSYAGLEEIKDSFFFSGKYKGGMVNSWPPRMFVFANEPPNQDLNGRFKVINLNL